MYKWRENMFKVTCSEDIFGTHARKVEKRAFIAELKNHI